MSTTNVSLIAVDNNDDLVFSIPLKMAEYEINPSAGGVLANGIPYQGSGGGGVVGARDFIAIRKQLPFAEPMGTTPIAVGIQYGAVSSVGKIFIYLDPRDNVQPGTGNHIESVTFNIYVMGLPDTSNPPFHAIFYTNMYTTDTMLSGHTETALPTNRRYSVTVNYGSAIYSPVDSWMYPGDCGLFMEFMPK